MSTEKKVLIPIFCIPVVAFLFFAILISLDVDPPDDDHLRFAYTMIPPGTNGYTGFFMAGNRIHDDGNKTCECEQNWDPELAKTLIENNVDALRFWEEAMERPEIQVPEIRSYDDLLPYLSKWRDLARLVSFKSRLLAEDGKVEDALRLAVAIVDFGHRQESEDGSLICSLVAIAIKGIGLERISQIVQEHEIPSPVLLDAATRLQGMTCDQVGFRDALRLEYTLSLRRIDRMASGRVNPNSDDLGLPGDMAMKAPFLFKKNQTKVLFADAYDGFIADSDKRYQDRTPVVRRRPQLAKFLLSGNMVGNVIFHNMVPYMSNARTKLDRCDVQLQSVRVELAAKAYRNDNGDTWPKTLEELVPNYLANIPTDPFAETPSPLRYVPERRIIYTVGEDGVDDGGMTIEHLEKMESGDWQWQRWKFGDPSFLMDKSLLPKVETVDFFLPGGDENEEDTKETPKNTPEPAVASGSAQN